VAIPTHLDNNLKIINETFMAEQPPTVKAGIIRNNLHYIDFPYSKKINPAIIGLLDNIDFKTYKVELRYSENDFFLEIYNAVVSSDINLTINYNFQQNAFIITLRFYASYLDYFTVYNKISYIEFSELRTHPSIFMLDIIDNLKKKLITEVYKKYESTPDFLNEYR
jgi:hypothetical protein